MRDEVDFSTPLRGSNVLRQVKIHYDKSSLGFETKLWVYGDGNRAKLKVWKKYPNSINSPNKGERKCEISLGFSENLIYCCRINLEGQRFRLVSQKMWLQFDKPLEEIIKLINEGFKRWEERKEREERVEIGRLQNMVALHKRGINAVACPDNIYWMRMKFGEHNSIDFTIDWNTLQFTVKRVSFPFEMGIESFQDLVRGLALSLGVACPSTMPNKAKRRITIDKSHIVRHVKRKPKYEGMK